MILTIIWTLACDAISSNSALQRSMKTYHWLRVVRTFLYFELSFLFPTLVSETQDMQRFFRITATLTKSLEQKINAFHGRPLHQILGLQWPQKGIKQCVLWTIRATLERRNRQKTPEMGISQDNSLYCIYATEGCTTWATATTDDTFSLCLNNLSLPSSRPQLKSHPARWVITLRILIIFIKRDLDVILLSLFVFVEQRSKEAKSKFYSIQWNQTL